MGNFWSRSDSADNEENNSTSEYYFYHPPRVERFFGSTFIMGNDKFDMSKPESYLFGDGYDLNFLGGKPNPFPYAAPLSNEPMQMLKSLINIRKETLRLVNPDEDDQVDAPYTIEFIFDSDVDCAITVYFVCKAEISTQCVKYIPKESTFRSETFHYKAGIGQSFSQSSPLFNPKNYNKHDLIYYTINENEKGDFEPSRYPVVIHCVAEEGEEPRQSHSLIAMIDKVHDNIFCMKPLKQTIFIDGLVYVLQEIYGIENKLEKNGEDENHKSFECVICMSELRDTLILPCRHLSLCQNCADALRYQANDCPICRAPFRALLQIKAVKRCSNNDNNGASPPANLSDSLNDVLMIDIPVGYETIPLVEALNGIHPKSTLDDKIDPTAKEGGDLTKVVEQENDDASADKDDSTANGKDSTEKSNEDTNDNCDKESFNSAKEPGEDCASASSSSSSSANTQENVQENTLLLKEKRPTSNQNQDEKKEEQIPSLE